MPLTHLWILPMPGILRSSPCSGHPPIQQTSFPFQRLNPGHKLHIVINLSFSTTEI